MLAAGPTGELKGSMGIACVCWDHTRGLEVVSVEETQVLREVWLVEGREGSLAEMDDVGVESREE